MAAIKDVVALELFKRRGIDNKITGIRAKIAARDAARKKEFEEVMIKHEARKVRQATEAALARNFDEVVAKHEAWKAKRAAARKDEDSKEEKRPGAAKKKKNPVKSAKNTARPSATGSMRSVPEIAAIEDAPKDKTPTRGAGKRRRDQAKPAAVEKTAETKAPVESVKKHTKTGTDKKKYKKARFFAPGVHGLVV